MDFFQQFDCSPGRVRADVSIVLGDLCAHAAHHRAYHRQGDVAFRQTGNERVTSPNSGISGGLGPSVPFARARWLHIRLRSGRLLGDEVEGIGQLQRQLCCRLSA
jgi:hypothetical protein